MDHASSLPVEPETKPITPLSLGTVSDSPAPNEAQEEPAMTQVLVNDDAKNQSQMQRWWQESISKSMNIQNGYKHVAVLIVKWQKELDELKVEKEVTELRSVFEDKFGYTTRTVELSLRNPQVQLISSISDFIMENDDRQNLLIVYYAGHGKFDDNEKQLEISGTNNIELDILSKVFWNDAEKLLAKNTAGDVLAIMDCCFASNLMMRSGSTVNSRAYELLAASSIDKLTESPGKYSFTRALIDCLNSLAERADDGSSFDTHELQQEINQVRTETPCQLWRVLSGNRRHIRLSPLRAPYEEQQAPEPSWTFEAPGGLLSLQFVIGDDKLDKQMIEKLTHHLPGVFRESNVQLRNIRWLDFDRPKSFPGLVGIVVQGKRFNERRKTLSSSPGNLSNINKAEKRKAADSPFMSAMLGFKRARASEPDYQASEDESIS